MRNTSTLLIYATLSIACVAQEAAVELPRFGPLPVPQGWRVTDKGIYAATPPSSWIVFKNGDQREFLSFYAFGPPRNEITNAVTFTDTAHEIFPDGRIAPGIKARPLNAPSSTSWNLSAGLVALQRYEALRYSFVAEFDGESQNLLAHGYVLFGDFAMIVQHTSDRPTTPEFVGGIANRVMERLAEISAPENLKVR